MNGARRLRSSPWCARCWAASIWTLPATPRRKGLSERDGFYSKADNGLAHPWAGRIFLNPPYSAVIARFVTKLLQELGAGRVSAAILLTNNSTDTTWFHQAMAAAAVQGVGQTVGDPKVAPRSIVYAQVRQQHERIKQIEHEVLCQSEACLQNILRSRVLIS